jgi:hypothetical protein
MVRFLSSGLLDAGCRNLMESDALDQPVLFITFLLYNIGPLFVFYGLNGGPNTAKHSTNCNSQSKCQSKLLYVKGNY